MEVKVIANETVKEAWLGVPRGHRHLRAVLVTEEGTLVISEAVLANLVRAYVTLKTHPTVKTVHLCQQQPAVRKEDFASFQLLECGEEEQVREEMWQRFWEALFPSSPSSG